MKKTGSFIIISMAWLLISQGCTKDNSPTASMNATIDNAAFAAVGEAHVISSGGGMKTLETVTAINLPVPGQPIATSITITVMDTAGSYTFTEANANGSVAVYLSSPATGGKSVAATSGQVTVTKSTSGYFQGTFSFNCTDSTGTLVVTNGQFTGTY